MDHLEIRAMLDGADGEVDAEEAAELADVGGDPDFANNDNLEHIAVADPGLHVAADMSDTKEQSIAKLEQVRKSYNDWNDNEVKEEQDFQAIEKQLWAIRMGQTVNWRRGWMQSPQTLIEFNMLAELRRLWNNVRESQEWVKYFKAEKVQFNADMDANEAKIRQSSMSMGDTDGDGTVELAWYWENDSLDETSIAWTYTLWDEWDGTSTVLA